MFEALTISTVVFFVIDWVIRLGFLLYIPKKRSPSAAIAWLLLVLLLPVLGVILFLLIGSPQLSRRRRAIQNKIDGLIERAVRKIPNKMNQLTALEQERYQPIIALGQSLGKMPLSFGNSAEIFPEYDEALKEITKAITKAQEFIHLEYFIIVLDEATQPLFDALEAAVKRGVKVRVLIDDMGYRAYPNKKQMKKELTRMGVEWYMMLPLKLGKKYNRPDLRNHRKIVVIDDDVAYIGSQNLVKRTYHRKDDLYYHELVVKMRGPIVRQCNAIFAGDWFGETGELLSKITNPDQRKIPKEAGSVFAQMVPSGPGYDVRNNLQLFVQLIYTAKKQVVITNPYFIPDESLIDACSSAARRGVEIIIINSEAMDQFAVGHAQRSFYEELLEAGVKIHLYKSPVFLHSKHMTIDDDIAVIGSSNMDIRSFALDLECVVVLYDKKVVSDLKKVQKGDLAHTKRLVLSKWKQRKLRYRFLESVTRLTSALQ